MKTAVALVALSVIYPAAAQTPAAKKPLPAKAAAATALPPFSGTWLLNIKRSALTDRVTGINKAIIQYDGKTWRYIHTHADSDEDLPDNWQRTMPVNSPTPFIEHGEEITYRAFLRRQGQTLVLTENGVTGHGQHIRNTVTYSLQDGGNTLVQKEVSVGPLGPIKNVYVLERQSTPGEIPSRENQ